eukprot:jgi/Bigna1/133954/aug1.23_g8662
MVRALIAVLGRIPTLPIEEKKKAKKGKKAKTAKAAPTPIPSVHESQMKHLRSMLSAVENHSDYVRITVFISNWKFAYVDLLMRTTDTFETVQRELEDKHGMISDFKLFKNDNGTPPQPGEEITDLKQTLGAAGFKGGVLRPDRKIALPQNATERGILHCEFEPVIKVNNETLKFLFSVLENFFMTHLPFFVKK